MLDPAMLVFPRRQLLGETDESHHLPKISCFSAVSSLNTFLQELSNGHLVQHSISRYCYSKLYYGSYYTNKIIDAQQCAICCH